MNIMTVEQDAMRIVSVFRAAFGEAVNLNPTGFLYHEGRDVTGTTYYNPKPANIFHIGVAAKINISNLSAVF